MKAVTSPGRNERHPPLPKLSMGRTRTRSRNDSGYEDEFGTPDWTSSCLEDTVQTWVARLEGVVRQEVERVRESTEVAKQEMKAAGEDVSKRDAALVNWRRQVSEMMELMSDLVECVNNDTKEVIYDTVGRCSSGQASSPLEEIEEDEEERKKNEEIMKLFLLSAMDEKKGNIKKEGRKRKRSQPKITMMKDFVALNKKNGKFFKKSRKQGREVQNVWSKLKKDDILQKRRHSAEHVRKSRMNKHRNSVSEVFEDAMYGMKMFQSIFEAEDIFEEWSWNLEVVVPYENYFEDWRWNFDNPKEADAIKSKFYDTTGVLNEWNDFNFWNNVGRSMDNIEIQFDGILNDIENQIDDNNDWMNWHYWENWGSNQAIPKALEETADCEAGTTVNFWEDSENNNDIVIALLQDIDTGNLADTEDEADKKESDWDCMLFWDDTDKNEEILKELVKLSEPCTKPVTEEETDKKGADWDCMLFWDDTGKNEEILKELVEFSEPCNKTVTEDPLGFWDDIEENKSILEGLLDVKSQSNKEDHWENWDFWNEFGQVKEILKAYEEILLTNLNRDHSPLLLSELCRRKVSSLKTEDYFGEWNHNLDEKRPSMKQSRKKKSKSKQKDFDKICWQISLENDGRRVRLTDEYKNLSIAESPDIFNDYSEEMEGKIRYYGMKRMPKDPINIFKSWRSVFDEPTEMIKDDKNEEEELNFVLDDMEEAYSDWISLGDVRTEKKRQARGMRKSAPISAYSNGSSPKMERKKITKSVKPDEVKKKGTRPGTPTITTVNVKPSCMEIFEYKLNSQDQRNHKKEKKTVHARSQKRLQAKIFAKQPRSKM